MRKHLIFLILFYAAIPAGKAQERNFFINMEALGSLMTSGNVPFWLRANQYGSIPPGNSSLGFISSLKKDYKKTGLNTPDWGASFEVRANLGQKSGINLIEGFVKMRYNVFEIKAGRMKDIMGLCDTALTSGSFSMSGNSLGIPKIEIAVPEYVNLPVWNGLISIKGNFVHGWLGRIPAALDGNGRETASFFHQKSLYLRLGRPEGKLKLYSGINHQVIWGNEKKIFGNDYTLSNLQTYFYVITGKAYSNGNIERSRVGNHLGSVDLGFEYEFENIKLLCYRQNFYDYTALRYLANIRDGLNGLSLINKRGSNRLIQWKRMLFEFMSSEDQGKGHPTNDPTFTWENYYNNYIYPDGWSYKGYGLGTPFITTEEYLRKGLSDDFSWYFVNNRVIAFHAGLLGSVKGYNFIIKTSFSKNYGTYTTGLNGTVNQFSAFIGGEKELKRGFKVGFKTAFDAGKLYNNSFGLLFTVSRSLAIF